MTDTEPEPDPAAVEVAELNVEMPKRRLSLEIAGRCVEVEGPDPLSDLVDVVAMLWPLTDPGPARTLGFNAGTTLITEIAVPPAADEDEA